MSKIVLNLLLLTFTLGLLFLMGEAGVRLGFPQGDFFYEYDDQLGARLIPNARGLWRVEDRVTPVVTNEWGFRGWNAPREKSANTIRVALIGDSYVEALQVEESAMVGNVLNDLLRERPERKRAGKKVEVLSFGVSGYGTAQGYLLYQEVVRSFEPDVVVAMVTVENDVRNNSQALEGEPTKPYFTLENEALNLKPPVIDASWAKRLNRFALRHSELYQFSILRLQRIFAKSPVGNEGYPEDYLLFACEGNETWKDAWDVTGKILNQWKQEVEGDGQRFLMARVPGFITVQDDKNLSALQEKYPAMKGGCWDRDRPTEQLNQIAAASRIDYIDLLPAFIDDFNATGQTSHLLKDGHWNERGHALGAKVLVEVIGPLLQ